MNCSNISEGGLPESSVAQSAINIGCQIIDVNNDISHKTRNGELVIPGHLLNYVISVSLTRGKNGFGFNIVGGEEGDDPGIIAMIKNIF